MRWRGHVFGQRSVVGSSSSALAWSWAVGRLRRVDQRARFRNLHDQSVAGLKLDRAADDIQELRPVTQARRDGPRIAIPAGPAIDEANRAPSSLCGTPTFPPGRLDHEKSTLPRRAGLTGVMQQAQRGSETTRTERRGERAGQIGRRPRMSGQPMPPPADVHAMRPGR